MNGAPSSALPGGLVRVTQGETAFQGSRSCRPGSRDVTDLLQRARAEARDLGRSAGAAGENLCPAAGRPSDPGAYRRMASGAASVTCGGEGCAHAWARSQAGPAPAERRYRANEGVTDVGT